MGKLSGFLAIAALAVGVYAVSLTGQKDDRIVALTQANGDLQDKLVALEARVEAGLGETGAAPFLRAAPDEAGVSTTGNAAPAAIGGLATRAASTPLERLAQLEKLVDAQKDELDQLRTERTERSGTQGAVQRAMANRFIGSVDMAAKVLELDERQQADMKDVQERARRELDDLFKLENDNGETWESVRKPNTRVIEGGGFSLAMPDMAKIQKFKKSRIPGSSETFGEAEKRIRDGAFGRMRNLLTPEQTKKWDKAHKEPLLRGGGSQGLVFSSVVLSPDDK